MDAFPALAEWIGRRPHTLLANAADWNRILAVVAWFRDHPRSGLYLRQVDIAGVDTKFIEGRRGLLAELLDVVQQTQGDEQFPRGQEPSKSALGFEINRHSSVFAYLTSGLR